MNSTKITIDGALMDKQFFEENIQEAKGYSWEQKPMAMVHDHSHCIVCTTTLPNNQSNQVFVSGSLLLCDYCQRHYMSL